MKIEKHKWQPAFKNETWVIDKRKHEEFRITLKQEEDILIEFSWDYGCGGRGSSSMFINFETLKQLIEELGV